MIVEYLRYRIESERADAFDPHPVDPTGGQS